MLKIIPQATRSDCLIWTGALNTKGYGRLKVKGEIILAHRFAFCVAHGLTLKEIKDLVIRHKCDNPSCINPTHLETGTPMDNIRDRVKRGRSAVGETNGSAKLTVEQVEEILAVYIPRHKEFGGVALGKKYGVSQTTISKIILKKLWKVKKRKSL
ncbi:HNH endonuclease [Lelliottia wanjuensis]|uniref:HNH endonuclease n=1 Tax=Lelliottia wanjuensis TaxID=3050585 RepID=UPI00254A4C21|nr:HNH endonuclease [Lelliottia sp. V86_10]MDK9585807.1 HNH endonuclease [Lelliottia sp. V86_10]